MKNTFYAWACLMLICSSSSSQEYVSRNQTPHRLEITANNGNKLRIEFFSNNVLRIRYTRKDEVFLPDDHYEMVENFNAIGTYKLKESANKIIADNGLITLEINKKSLLMKFIENKHNSIILSEEQGIAWKENTIQITFKYDKDEHFCGMGYQAFGLVKSIDLKDSIVSCNYGEGISTEGDYGRQAVLTVPFYLSSKGYGIFLNNTFQHSFNFGKNGDYSFKINTHGFNGQMDYFFIYGSDFSTILNRYVDLTGYPRLPQRSIFGLQLSDKGEPNNNGETWWKNKITEHRKAGYPIDHIVNDNRWRSGTGAWSGSWFEWDSTRYPNPADYNQWLVENKLTIELDLNRNNCAASWGWKPEYNLPQSEKYVKEGFSAPDYSNPETRQWVWNLFWKKTLDPALKYPGDALWIDETDEMWKLPDSLICANGRSWTENKNYYPFLIAKGIVQEGWDSKDPSHPGIGEAKRPFVWARSLSAGSQRYITGWTGDLRCDYEWMKKNVRAMQVSGLCGFPYFNHDAGGFREPGPDDNMYIQWGMAWASFTPIWRPHGPGINKRWPLDRSEICRKEALKYATLRYQLMPYIYTAAYNAHATGMPMAKAMVIDYQNSPEAWKYDLQYMWGDNMLIAPACSDKDTTLYIWLPKGNKWIGYWDDVVYSGDQILKYNSRFGELPLFIKEGAIIPTYNFALSTFLLDNSKLNLDIYCGNDGNYKLYEDDGITEKFSTRNEYRTTKIDFFSKQQKLVIYPSNGKYENAPITRSYNLNFHNIKKPTSCVLNGKEIRIIEDDNSFDKDSYIATYYNTTQKFNFRIPVIDVNEEIVIEIK